MTRSIEAIDLTPLRAGDSASLPELARRVDRACRDTGFLIVTGHGIDPDLLARMFDLSHRFFHQPAGIKEGAIARNGEMQRGYIRYQSQYLARTRGVETPPDLRECLMMGRPGLTGAEHADRPQVARFYKPSVWPSEPADLREIGATCFEAFEQLAGRIMTLFARALDLPGNFFESRIDDAFNMLNSIYYPPGHATEAGQLRAGAHSDYGSLTIVTQRGDCGGLQINRDGDWVDIAPPPGACVVNIGDMMQRWTNDRWVSTLHRVAEPPDGSDRERQSLAFFLHPNYDAIIETLPGCVTPDRPLRYPPITAGEYMSEKILQARGLKAATP